MNAMGKFMNRSFHIHGSVKVGNIGRDDTEIIFSKGSGLYEIRCVRKINALPETVYIWIDPYYDHWYFGYTKIMQYPVIIGFQEFGNTINTGRVRMAIQELKVCG